MDPPKLRIFRGEERDAAAELQSIKDRIQNKYAPKLAKAGPLRRAFLRLRMRHELETELEKYAQTLAARL